MSCEHVCVRQLLILHEEGTSLGPSRQVRNRDHHIVWHSGSAIGERQYAELGRVLKTRGQVLNFIYLEDESNGVNANGVVLKTVGTGENTTVEAG